ncbi:cytochrome b/b6 domain-containing protein [Ralstonia pseudosolanacearum]|uniref:cytochrome b/b6 domain-containing protein n=1 Tax=Ralstonia pseudosolanacearum TaxID=1310165 RepID=UPI000CE459C5|nr:cytochrome b/b6 domain-containing protein [Ralstonia pseudosolanacearum]MDO3623708.1 cytochrome b/b6 domain-containing protein [Ralstonia pseudosolanacearum]
MTSSEASVPVWDKVVRLTHWGVAALVLWELYEDSGGPLHRGLGYAAVALAAVRLAWGWIGSEAARFRTWAPRPAEVVRYVKALCTGRAPRHLSHNPAGAVVMFAMWTLILALGATGWLSRLDAFWGEDWPTDLHGLLADALAVLIVIHVAAAIVMSALHRENLIHAMLTGRKRRD